MNSRERQEDLEPGATAVQRQAAPGPVTAPGRSPVGLAALLVVMGLLHFIMPGPFERLVPRWLGHARLWVALSGAAEVVCGAALLPMRTRRIAAWGAAATLVAVFPANIQMAMAAGAPRAVWSAALWLRLPLQIPLVAWALRYTRPAAGGASALP